MALHIARSAERLARAEMPGVDYVLESEARASVPAVSVVITTHDHAAYIADAVAAVAAQDLGSDVETIVCDNASSDGTEQLMAGLVTDAIRPLTYVRLLEDIGPARSRNIGVRLGRGRFVAFTDADCVPRPGWLRAALSSFGGDRTGVVQGQTVPTESRVPLFEHHIAIDHLDGTFATANVVYRRDAISGLEFDPSCRYWEDVDLGWRVLDAGWDAKFAPEAVVAHRVVAQSARQWMTWPAHYRTLPAIVSRHPGYRRHLFLGMWVRPLDCLFDIAVIGCIAAFWRWEALVLVIPYVIAFFRVRGVSGRFPPAKIAAYLAWDLTTLVTVVVASVRHRALVL